VLIVRRNVMKDRLSVLIRERFMDSLWCDPGLWTNLGNWRYKSTTCEERNVFRLGRSML
jgi:hypothetical protein